MTDAVTRKELNDVYSDIILLEIDIERLVKCTGMTSIYAYNELRDYLHNLLKDKKHEYIELATLYYLHNKSSNI